MDRWMKRRFSIGLGSCDQGGPRVSGLPSAGEKTREAGGVLQAEAKGNESGASDVRPSWSLTAREPGLPTSQGRTAGTAHLPFLCLFVVFRP